MHLATRSIQCRHDQKEEHSLEVSMGKQCQLTFAWGTGQPTKRPERTGQELHQSIGDTESVAMRAQIHGRGNAGAHPGFS